MSISNLSLRGTLLTCTSVNATTFTLPLPLNAQIAPQITVLPDGSAPAGSAPYYKVIATGTATGGNALVLGTIRSIAAYPGNAAGAAPVYPAGFSVDVTGTNLIFRSGAADTSNYVFTLY
jgi:hypothetical protein